MLKGRYITKEIVLDSPAAGVHTLWRAPVACKVTALRAIRTGGTGAVVNAMKNATDLKTTDLSLTSADQWMGGATGLAATSVLRLAAGDTLKAEVVSVAGSPTSLTIQVDLVTAADVH